MRNGLLTILIFAMSLGFFQCLTVAPAAGEDRGTVFAAASTTNTLTDIAKIFEQRNQGKVRYSFASSSTLAKQIDNGAPAEVFLSANPKWVESTGVTALFGPSGAGKTSIINMVGGSYALTKATSWLTVARCSTRRGASMCRPSAAASDTFFKTVACFLTCPFARISPTE